MDSIKQNICSRFQKRCAAEGTTTETSANVCKPAGGIGKGPGPAGSGSGAGPGAVAGGGGGGVELVPLLARRRANNRPISLSSTDVTKRTVSNDRYACQLNNNNNMNSSHDTANRCCFKKFTLHIR